MKKFQLGLIALVICTACSESPKEPIVWKSIEKDLQAQFILAQDGDVIELPEGNFMFTRTLSMDGKSNITIRGKGMDKTILSWKNQAEGAQGLQVSNGKNIVLEDFSVEDAKGDNLKVNDTDGIVLRRIRSVWADGPKTENGAYALYPVLCKNVLMEDCIAMGSSDAGIYVGQSDSVIIRNNKAYWNVAGIESENSKWVEIYGNEAYDNTGGILVFDLPGLTTYGHTTKVYNNTVRSNNHTNFAQKGNVVASIPPGSGMMILATNTVDIYDNDFINNRSVGIAVVSYELVAALNAGEQEQENAIGGVQTVDNRFREDSLYNPYPYNVKIRNNRFSNKHWFPTMESDIGKLLLMKSFFNPPDIIYDGIEDPDRKDRNICVGENGKLTFINLDAGNDFKGLSKDVTPFKCN
ncbi:MAG: right-handed parallel beta-helix repeat-containing protein [Cyclobacteriaceae bacterium]|nr:right-handed parallel beta-helix repeat-containing protein [Cyclobacteriaceae bacterium]UYN87162.1 MAG: right-handed parallel beta-helix repeat-containing protein [Cyclobacteriaceae bacterium]